MPWEHFVELYSCTYFLYIPSVKKMNTNRIISFQKKMSIKIIIILILLQFVELLNMNMMDVTMEATLCVPINESGFSPTCKKCGWIYKFCVCRRR